MIRLTISIILTALLPTIAFAREARVSALGHKLAKRDKAILDCEAGVTRWRFGQDLQTILIDKRHSLLFSAGKEIPF
jgi:hypothetical protein